MKKILSVLLLVITFPAFSQTPCNTASPKVYILAQGNGEIYRPNGSSWKGGDTVRITGTSYSVVEFYNVGGDACRPLVVDPGEGFTTNALRFKGNCRYIKFLPAKKKYGVVIKNGALTISLSHHIEVENMEIYGASIGVYCKQDPEYGNPDTYGTSGYVMRKITLKNLWVHDVGGEGMYVGITAPEGVIRQKPNGVDTLISSIPLDSVEIINCLVENCDWDGIQLSHALNGNNILNNTVRNVGLINKSQQMNGIILGGNTNGNVIGNNVTNAPAAGIAVFGFGVCNIDNNVLTNTGNGKDAKGTPANEPAMYFNKNHSMGAKLQVNCYNNTIDGANNNGIVNAVQTNWGTPGQWKNNTITNIRAGIKYKSSIGDQVTGDGSTAPVIPSPAATVTQAYHDSVVAAIKAAEAEKYQVAIDLLSSAKQSLERAKNDLQAANKRIDELSEYRLAVEAYKKAYAAFMLLP